MGRITDTCGDDLGELMRRYVTARQELEAELSTTITGLNPHELLTKLSFVVVSRANQPAFAAVELVADMAQRAPAGRGVKPSDSTIAEVLDICIALSFWQRTVGHAQLATSTVVATGDRRLVRLAQLSADVDRWYHPVDLLRSAVLSLGEGLDDEGNPGRQPLWRFGAGLDATAILDIHDAIFRLVMRRVAGSPDSERAMAGLLQSERRRIKETPFTAPAMSMTMSPIDIANGADRTEAEVLDFLAPLSTEWNSPHLRPPPDRRGPYRSNHPFILRPFLRLDSGEFILAELYQLGRAVLASIERTWMASSEAALYNQARSSWVERAVAARASTTWGTRTAANVRWRTTTANGEADVIFRVGSMAAIAECKSHVNPVKSFRDTVRKPSAQLRSLDEAVSADGIDGLITTCEHDLDDATFRGALAAPHQLRLVVLGTDFTTLTTAAAHLGLDEDPQSPLFLSLPDFLLITAALEPADALTYLAFRYLMRTHPLAASTDEEMLLAEYVSGGLTSGLRGLGERSTRTGAASKYGALSRFMAWRNVWAPFRNPDRPRLKTSLPPDLARLVADLRSSSCSSPPLEVLLASLWPTVLGDMLKGARERGGRPRSVWMPVQLAGSSTAVLVGVATGQHDQAKELLAAELRGERVRFFRDLHPEVTALIVMVSWQRHHPALATVAYEGDDSVLLHPTPPIAHDVFRPEPPPGRNQPCWCGSGSKTKKCESHHQPTLAARAP